MESDERIYCGDQGDDEGFMSYGKRTAQDGILLRSASVLNRNLSGGTAHSTVKEGIPSPSGRWKMDSIRKPISS